MAMKKLPIILAAIFDKAYVKVETIHKGIFGFLTAGIWPFEPNKFSEDDFGPNEPSDFTAIEIPINLNETEVNIETSVDLIPGSSETNQGLYVPIETLVPVPILKQTKLKNHVQSNILRYLHLHL
ncbi:hypothetical protein HHI36_002392 [Cryptolaemus montrouzieri]|uniref:Uncharacterized protein n=1 Tax=Cryptolaemus montrouzieri TaxID=559131 RepID=A0ABD2PB00_9CUCU